MATSIVRLPDLNATCMRCEGEEDLDRAMQLHDTELQKYSLSESILNLCGMLKLESTQVWSLFLFVEHYTI